MNMFARIVCERNLGEGSFACASALLNKGGGGCSFTARSGLERGDGGEPEDDKGQSRSVPRSESE